MKYPTEQEPNNTMVSFRCSWRNPGPHVSHRRRSPTNFRSTARCEAQSKRTSRGTFTNLSTYVVFVGMQRIEIGVNVDSAGQNIECDQFDLIPWMAMTCGACRYQCARRTCSVYFLGGPTASSFPTSNRVRSVRTSSARLASLGL